MNATTILRPITSLLPARVARMFKRDIPIERYVVRANHEWAIFYIDEKLGAFNCQSTYGTYAYIWRSIGERTLKEFLLDLNFDYFMGKTRPGYRTFDYDRTCEKFKRLVREGRRQGSISKEIAREAYDDVEWLEADNPTAFVHSMSDAQQEAIGRDYYELASYSPDTDSKQFWEIIWPEFLKQIGGRK